MSRFGFGRRGQSGRHMTFFRRRRPDDWASEHERARVLTALELVERLPAADGEWLAEHLLGCIACTERATGYAEDRRLLLGLRDTAPEPPRDLWARTAAAIEAEATRRARPARFPVLPKVGALPLGVASGVLVVAVVVGVTLTGRATPDVAVLPSPTVSTTQGPRQTPGPTPLAVPPNEVAWVERNEAGTYDLVVAGFDAVCGAAIGAECAPIDSSSGRSIELNRAPGSVVLSPAAPQVVVVDADASTTGGAIFVVPVPTPQPSQEPGASPSSPTPTATASPSATPNVEPTDVPSASPSESPEATPASTPVPTPTPIAEGSVAIIQDVIVVGDAAYSADGSWFAFSARPQDGSTGPDIYVWHVGDDRARAVTSDHRSVFSGWLDDLVLGSRAVEVGVVIDDLGPTPSPAPSAEPGATPDGEPSPTIEPVFDGVTFVLDPGTGVAADVEGSSWRPAVDPEGRLVIRWEGALLIDASRVSWTMGAGRLVVDAWVPSDTLHPLLFPDPTSDPSTTPDPSQTPEPSTTPEPASTAMPSSTPAHEPTIVRSVITEGPILDFDARWDPTGTRLAVWIADPADPRLGSLRLYVVDPATGALSGSSSRLDGAPALRGFSLSLGRLAWITPPGQDGEGSRVHVVAWSLGDFGTIESTPGSELIVGQ